MIKNYYIQFMDNTTKLVTAEQAGGVADAIHQGKKAVIVNGGVYPVHQITAVKRVTKDEERYILENAGVIKINAPSDKLELAMQKYSIEAKSKKNNNNNLKLL